MFNKGRNFIIIFWPYFVVYYIDLWKYFIYYVMLVFIDQEIREVFSAHCVMYKYIFLKQ